MATFPCLGPPPPHAAAMSLTSLRLWLVLLVVTCCCHVTQGARVLLVPLPDTSQCRQAVSIGRALKARGHTVTLFVPDYFRVRRCTEPAPPPGSEVGIRTFDTSEGTEEAVLSKLDKVGDEVMGGGTGLLGGSGSARAALEEVCLSYLEGREGLDALRRQGRVDVVLLDGSPGAHCLALLPAYLGAPFVLFGSYIAPYDSGSPLPYASYPAPLSGLPGNLGFLQRLTNFLSYASQQWSAQLGGDGGGFHQGNALGPRVAKLHADQLVRKAVLYLENSDHVLDYPKASFPNLLQVGGVTAGPAAPLPGPLARFFTEAGEDGVVVVSLGPNIFSPSAALQEKLLGAFRQLDAKVLVRLNETRAVSRVRNVQAVGWFPQSDALGHANTKVFVSHCGPNSFFEALHHGVPVVCCRFGASDVLGTGQRVAEYGVGVSVDLLTVSAETLRNSIDDLLEDPSYTRRAKAASKLFHSRAEAPRERAASAVEHVLKFGGGYLKPRVADMGFFQYAGLDVALALFSFVFGVVGLLCVFVLQRLPSSGGAAREQSEKQGEMDSSSSGESEQKPKAVVSAEKEISAVSKLVMYVLAIMVVLFYIFF